MNQNHLHDIGLTAYYEELQKILTERYPDGYSSSDWNTASAEAIVRATAKMIIANNQSL